MAWYRKLRRWIWHRRLINKIKKEIKENHYYKLKHENTTESFSNYIIYTLETRHEREYFEIDAIIIKSDNVVVKRGHKVHWHSAFCRDVEDLGKDIRKVMTEVL